jgi:mannosyltransferase OCH1-like enzyme
MVNSGTARAIPGIIHYCWFGGAKIPRQMRKFVDGWKKFHPSFEFIKWSEENAPAGFPYLDNALRNGKWANASNFTRLFALKSFGGIYLDTDIEMLKPYDPFLSYSCFLGFENRDVEATCVNNAVMGALKGHPFTEACFEKINTEFDGSEAANLSSPVLTTEVLKSKGPLSYGKVYRHDWDVQLFPVETFYAFQYGEKLDRTLIDDRTYSIHHYKASWHPPDKNKQIKRIKAGLVKLRDQLRDPFK